MANNGVVNGNVQTTGSTFQTGDIINGISGNTSTTLNIEDISTAGAAVAATVNNIGAINHVMTASNSYNEFFTAV